MTVRGLVAAAGRSTRMGHPKALLTRDGQPVVALLVDALLAGGAASVVVTVPPPPDDDAIRAALARAPVQVTPNAFDDDGLIGSVRTAIADLGADDVVVVNPVDAPFTDAPLVRALLAALDADHVAAVPVRDARPGHPVAIRVAAVRAHLEVEGGLRGVLAVLGAAVAHVAWADARVTVNVNTPAEAAALGLSPRATGRS